MAANDTKLLKKPLEDTAYFALSRKSFVSVGLLLILIATTWQVSQGKAALELGLQAVRIEMGHLKEGLSKLEVLIKEHQDDRH